MYCSWYPTPESPLNGIFCRELAALLATRCKVSVAYVRYKADGGKPEIKRHAQPGFDEYEISIPRKSGLFSMFYHQYHVRSLLNQCLKMCTDLDLIHVQVGWKAAWDVAFTVRKKNIPFVVTEHNTDWLPQDRQYPAWKRKLTAWALRRASAITAVSANLAENVAAATRKPVQVIPNPVAQEFTNAKIADAKPGGSVFLHVSNFNFRQKQTHKIIRVFSQYAQENPHARLQLNVPEDAFHAYKSANPHYSWDKIALLVPNDDKTILLKRMQNADFLLSYSRFETFGLVIAEALCLGVPTIYTPCQGADLYIDEKMGISCDADNDASLLEAMRKTEGFSTDRSYIAAKARQQFNAEAVSDAYEALYQKLIK
ncbi:MAG: glycosyltransferase family 4 protein [Sphingomonadales bacterium]